MTEDATATKSAEYHLGMLDCWLITSRAPEQIKRALKQVHLKLIAGTDARAESHPLNDRVIIEKGQDLLRAIEDHNARQGDGMQLYESRNAPEFYRGSKSVIGSAGDCKSSPIGSEGSNPSFPTSDTPAGTAMDNYRNEKGENRELDAHESQKRFPGLSRIAEAQNDQRALNAELTEAVDAMPVAQEKHTWTRDQKVDLIRMKKFAGRKWHEIAEALQLPEKKVTGYWSYLQQQKDFEQLCIDAKLKHDNPKLWAIGSPASQQKMGNEIRRAIKAQIEQEPLENYRRPPVDQVKKLATSAEVAAIKATAPRPDTPPDVLIEKHNDYAGKRDPVKQELQDSDWPDIQEMLRKGRNIRQVAHDYEVPFDVMNDFCDKHLLREARESDERSRKHNLNKGK